MSASAPKATVGDRDARAPEHLDANRNYVSRHAERVPRQARVRARAAEQLFIKSNKHSRR